MKSEMDSIAKDNSQELVQVLHRRNAFRCYWAFKIKHNADRTIDRCKASLVGQEILQKKRDSIIRPLLHWYANSPFLAVCLKSEQLRTSKYKEWMLGLRSSTMISMKKDR